MSAADTGLVAVTLLAPSGSLNAGEVAGFAPDVAEAMIKAGQAEAFDATASNDEADKAAADKAAADKAAADKAKA